MALRRARRPVQPQLPFPTDPDPNPVDETDPEPDVVEIAGGVLIWSRE
jgi:hypothetical protein